jgi:hypothetical protein
MKERNLKPDPAFSNISAIEKLVALGRTTGLGRDEGIANALNFLVMNPDDPLLMEYVEDQFNDFLALQAIDPDPFRATNPISNEELPGNVGLGIIQPAGIPWCITPEMLTTHILILGRSGGGKSNLIFLILVQLLAMRQHDQNIR